MNTENRHPVRRVGIIYKIRPYILEVAQDIQQWFEERKHPVWTGTFLPETNEMDEVPDLDLLLVLGGDGTMITVLHKLLGRGIPVVGINFGKVGFLAELTQSSWKEALEKAMAEGIALERRMSLSFRLKRGGETLASGNVVNDAVVTRGKLARLVRLRLWLEGEELIQLRADGMVISTPTGSTGYCCSAGGGLLHPALNAFSVTAICPFLNVFPPLTLDGGDTFAIELLESYPDVYLTLDGHETIPLFSGDMIEITGNPGNCLFGYMGTASYGARLKRSKIIAS
jgi:Predicted sugar kinase